MRLMRWLLLGLFFPMTAFCQTITEADKLYHQGEIAKTAEQRKDAFAQALNIYQKFAEDRDLEYSSGKVYYNLANTYFQLKSYPLAILYYYKALKLLSEPEIVQSPLKSALVAAGLQGKDEERTMPFSLPENLRLFFFSFIFCYGAFSLYLWYPKPL